MLMIPAEGRTGSEMGLINFELAFTQLGTRLKKTGGSRNEKGSKHRIFQGVF
jgi:hypothetical protein